MRHSYNIQSFSRKLPSKEIPNFEETVGTVAEEFRRLASILLQIIAVSLGTELEHIDCLFITSKSHKKGLLLAYLGSYNN